MCAAAPALLAFLHLPLLVHAWVWERPVTTGSSLLPRAGHSLTAFQPSRSSPQLWQCGGFAGSGAAVGGCSVISPYSSWGIADHSSGSLANVTGRFSHSAVVLGSTDLLYLWGGLTGPAVLALNDEPTLVQLDSVAVVPQASLVQAFPFTTVAPRYGHSAVGLVVAAKPAMLLYGGADLSGDIAADSALVLCTLTQGASPAYTLTWTRVSARGAAQPPPRHYHAAAVYPSPSSPTSMLVVGGFSAASSAALGDAWELNLAGCAWDEASEAGSLCSWQLRTPLGLPPLYGHTLLITLKGTVLVYGGEGSEGASSALLASANYAPGPGSTGSNSAPATLSFSRPAAEGTPPTALFLSSAAMLDADGDAEDEMVAVGGQLLHPSPAAVPQQGLAVLSGIGDTYPPFTKELPFLLGGIFLACAMLGTLAYLAWRRSGVLAGGGQGKGLAGEGGESSALLAALHEEEGFEPSYGGLSSSASSSSSSSSSSRRPDLELGQKRALSLGMAFAGAGDEGEVGGAGSSSRAAAAGRSASKGRSRASSRASTRAAVAEDLKQELFPSGAADEGDEPSSKLAF